MSSASPAPADRVVTHPGSGFHLLIYSMYEKPGWQPHTPATRTRPPHPGSAIDYQGQLYEIMEIGPGEGMQHTYRYALRRWEDRFVVRRVFPYTAQTERIVAQQAQEHRRRHRHHWLILYTFPLSTQLPTEVIQRWWREWGLPMSWMSLASGLIFALPMFWFGMHLFVLVDQGKPWLKMPALIFIYTGMEQAVRVIWIAFSREP